MLTFQAPPHDVPTYTDAAPSLGMNGSYFDIHEPRIPDHDFPTIILSNKEAYRPSCFSQQSAFKPFRLSLSCLDSVLKRPIRPPSCLAQPSPASLPNLVYLPCQEPPCSHPSTSASLDLDPVGPRCGVFSIRGNQGVIIHAITSKILEILNSGDLPPIFCPSGSLTKVFPTSS